MFKEIRSTFSAWLGLTPKKDDITGGPRLDVIDPRVFDTSDGAALKVSAVFSAVKLISEGIARLPLTAQRYNNAAQCYVPDHASPTYKVLRLKPNEDMSSFELWRAAIQSMLLHGNAYIVPSRNDLGEIIALTLLTPDSTVYDTYARIYVVNDYISGIHGVYRPSQIIHLRNISLDGGLTGLSTVQMAAYALGIVRLADKNSATTLTTGGRTRGFLSGDAGGGFADSSEVQLMTVANRVENDILGGKTVVAIPSEMKYQPFTLTPADAKVLESKEMTIRDLARFFRVHPDLLYEGSNNTYKAAEVPNVMFLTQTLEPLLVQIEQELAIKLLPPNMLGKKRYRFDREALYSTDLATEALYFEKMLQTGIYTVNELRAKKGLSPVAEGDVAMVSANLKSLKTIINENKNEQTGNSLDQ